MQLSSFILLKFSGWDNLAGKIKLALLIIPEVFLFPECLVNAITLSLTKEEN